jgi:hypothetical protein
MQVANGANVANAANGANRVFGQAAVPPRREGAAVLWHALFATETVVKSPCAINFRLKSRPAA